MSSLHVPRSIAPLVALAWFGTGCSLLSLDALDAGGGEATTSVGATTSSTGDATTGVASTTGGGDGGGATVAATSMQSASAVVGSGGAGGVSGDGGASGVGGSGASGPTGTGGGAAVSPCESTPILDRFDRADGPLGASWVDGAGLTIASERAQNVPSEVGYKRAAWFESFGPDQEAHAVLAQVDRAGQEQLLLLKIQGDANLEVLFAPTSSAIEVWACSPGCVLETSLSVDLPDGARLAARADAAGLVRVCLDGELVTETDVSDWAPYFSQGGRVGFGTVRNDPADEVFAFDDFGGGDVAP